MNYSLAMGTTVWLSTATREDLRRLQGQLGLGSVDAAVRHLLARPAVDARTLFAAHRREVALILRRHGLQGLVAFGSRARGDATVASDLDLAAFVKASASPMALLSAEADLEAELGVPVNLVELPNPVVEVAIAREGVPFAE